MRSILDHFNGEKYRVSGNRNLNGYPINQPGQLNLKQEEMENLPVALTVRTRIFNMFDPADLAAYTDIRDKVANGRFIPLIRKEIVSPDGSVFKVFLEWAEPEAIVPPEIQRRF